MKEGDVILTPILQADDLAKNRPAPILRELPPFQDLLFLFYRRRILKFPVIQV